MKTRPVVSASFRSLSALGIGLTALLLIACTGTVEQGGGGAGTPSGPVGDPGGFVLGSGFDQLQVGIYTAEVVTTPEGTREMATDTRTQIARQVQAFGYDTREAAGDADLGSDPEALRQWAAQRGYDIAVGVYTEAEPFDTLGNYVIYQADGTAQVLRVSDGRLLGTSEFNVRGERKLGEGQARMQALQAVGKQIGPWVVSKLTPDNLGLASETVTIDYRLRTEFDEIVRTVRGIPSVVDVRVVSEDYDAKKAVLRVVYDKVQQRRPMVNEIADRLDYKVR
ncbi:MAG: hypothetical protein ACFE0O_05425 [Opitutales bacterium]